MIRPHWRSRSERWLFEFLVIFFLRSRRRLHVSGLENIPRTGPLIVIANHVATMDPPLVGTRLHRKDVYYLAKMEAYRRRIARFFLEGWNAFPVVRHSADRRAMDFALRVLRQGHVLVVFPEGSRSRDATLTRAYPGAGFIARRSGAPVVPAAIWGSEHMLPKGRIWPRKADVFVRFGPPMHVAAHTPDGRRTDNQEAVDELMRAVAALLPEQYRGVYDGRPLEQAPAVDGRSAA